MKRQWETEELVEHWTLDVEGTLPHSVRGERVLRMSSVINLISYFAVGDGLRSATPIKSEASRAMAHMREQLTTQRIGDEASALAKLG